MQEEVKDILHIFITFSITKGRYQLLCILNDGISTLFVLSYSLTFTRFLVIRAYEY